MRPGSVLAAAFVVWISASANDAFGEQRLMQCDSSGYRYQYCPADTQGRVVLLQEVSTGNLCRQGRGWGFDNNGIWVDKGCRGKFSYGRYDGGGGGGWDRPGRLMCESISYRYRYCNANTYDRVSLIREISTGNLCRQGRGWGYDSGGIWVDKGCRGEFRYGRDDSRRDNAAIAAGILSALGAVIGSSQNEPPPRPSPASVPSWAPGSYSAYDPESEDNVLLNVRSSGEVSLRNEVGGIVNSGHLRDGLIYWRNGKQSWFAREGPGVMLGDVGSGKHYYFRRSG